MCKKIIKPNIFLYVKRIIEDKYIFIFHYFVQVMYSAIIYGLRFINNDIIYVVTK